MKLSILFLLCLMPLFTNFAQEPERMTEIPGAKSEIYRQVGKVTLRLYIFLPPDYQPSDRRPAMIMFFGGSWERGKPTQFSQHAAYFASRGMVVILPDYRTKEYYGSSPLDCVADAKAALRWVRSNATKWGIDPTRIAVAGGSAGGYLAAATLLDGLEEPGADTSVSCRPDAAVLFNPVLDTTPTGFRSDKFGDRAFDASPVHHLHPGMPPTIIFHGKADTLVPCEQAERYTEGMNAAGNVCRLVTYEGQGHGFYIRKPPYYVKVIQEADRFLASLGWLQGDPTTPPPLPPKSSTPN